MRHKTNRFARKRLYENCNIESYTPQVYVGTYEKYNNGSLEGEWVDLTDFDNLKDFYRYIRELHKDEREPEFMFQDMEYIPKIFGSEYGLSDRIYDYINDDDHDFDIKYAVACECSYADEYFEQIENITIYWSNGTERYDMSDVAYDIIEEQGNEVLRDLMTSVDCFDYEKLGREVSMDYTEEDDIYEMYGVSEDDDYSLGVAVVDEMGIENINFTYYVDYKKLGDYLNNNDNFVKFDRGYIELY